MSGVMFWVFDGLSYGLFPLLTLILPGSAALLHALFLIGRRAECEPGEGPTLLSGFGAVGNALIKP